MGEKDGWRRSRSLSGDLAPTVPLLRTLRAYGAHKVAKQARMQGKGSMGKPCYKLTLVRLLTAISALFRLEALRLSRTR